jgi:hypothetical protein
MNIDNERRMTNILPVLLSGFLWDMEFVIKAVTIAKNAATASNT